MIFNEIYGCYYHAVGQMIRLAIDGELTEAKMNQIASELAFEESLLTIVPALKDQEWQLIDREYRTPINKEPVMPLTITEKRWLKTVLQDPRAVLFRVPQIGLEDVEPLFEPGDIVYFDRYLDGDPYEDPSYIANFHMILQAIREHRKVRITFLSRKNRERTGIFIPVKIEYSDKEDKFRIVCAGDREVRMINIARIVKCEYANERFPENIPLPERKMEILVFELTDERNTLERAMMKFSHYKKEVERIGDNTYHVQMEYDQDDETDVLIQIMNFGSYVKVLAPAKLKEQLCRRIAKQLTMLDW